MLSKRFLFGAAVIVATIALAALLGVGAGNLMAEKKARDVRKMRAAFTDQILEQLENLQVGDTLPNATLMDLERNFVTLHSKLQDQTLIVCFDYSCENCLIELEHLGETVGDKPEAANILLISATNPLYLLDARQEYGLKSPILYDDHQQFLNALGVNSYPFNLFVGRDGVIDSVIASPLGGSDFKQFLQSIRSL